MCTALLAFNPQKSIGSKPLPTSIASYCCHFLSFYQFSVLKVCSFLDACCAIGRELAKFMASVQAAVYGTRDATLTGDLFKTILQFKVKEHHRRAGFRDDKDAYLT